MASPIMILPESFAARVRPILQRLDDQRFIARLWERDANLWTSDPALQHAIRNRLGWLSIARVMESHVAEIQAVADGVRQAGFSHALLLGMGGSSLFAEVCRAIIGVAPGWLDLQVLDSTDPAAIATALQRAPIERTLFLVSSKSGTTIEVSALANYCFEIVRQAVGPRAGQQFLAITDAGTPLETLAAGRSFRHLFVHGPTTGHDVGGRFSALTYFGLVPAALMGIDLRRLLAAAAAMSTACGPATSILENPAAQLGALLGEAARIGKDKVTLLAPSRVSAFGAWAEQLIAESTGKAGKGLVPIDGEPLRDPRSYPSDRLFVEVQLTGEVDATLRAQATAVAEAGHPVACLEWQDPYALGGEAVRWCVATVIAAHLMQINPFDEPNVQESKDRTAALLEQVAKTGQLPQDVPHATDGPIAISGSPRLSLGRTLSEAVQGLLQRLASDEYLAIVSFLPRTPELDAAIAALRHAFATHLSQATTLSIGPRYLHSIGQLYKGGPDRGGFLMLLADDPRDLSVPSRPYSFGVLKRAQAWGDIRALEQRNRRVLVLHLGDAPAKGLSRLMDVVKTWPTVPAAHASGT